MSGIGHGELAASVRGLEKHYSGFTLGPLDFDIRAGRIVGFIGRNGAGKTTTIKAMLGLVRPDGGSVSMLGRDIAADERGIKAEIGYAGGAVGWYKKKRIKQLAAVTASFYPSWDDSLWRRYTDMFSLDTGKTPEQLSEGMRVKLSLALALSHGARLLILDEPTSGLDPISREELLDVLLDLAGDGKTVFFSTHIVSDLEKCADDIIFIRDGKIALSGAIDDIEREWTVIPESVAVSTVAAPTVAASTVAASTDTPSAVAGNTAASSALSAAAVGRRRGRDGATLLVPRALLSDLAHAPSLEEIIIHLENGVGDVEASDDNGAPTSNTENKNHPRREAQERSEENE